MVRLTVRRLTMFHLSGQDVAGGHVRQRRTVNRLADLLRRQKTFGGSPDVKFTVVHARHSPCSVLKTEGRPLRSGNSKKGWLA
jgi:hypothetical protein